MLLVDGHNLIPKIAGLSLSNLDDEQELIAYLTDYCVARGRSLEVFFDGAPVGQSGKRVYGRVTAHFVRQGRTADEAIRMRLEQLGRGARNASVVSSDRQVQAEARNHGAQTLRSEDFAAALEAVRRASAPRKENTSEARIPPQDVQEFLDLFGGEPQEGPPPPAAQGGKRSARRRTPKKL